MIKKTPYFILLLILVICVIYLVLAIIFNIWPFNFSKSNTKLSKPNKKLHGLSWRGNDPKYDIIGGVGGGGWV